MADSVAAARPAGRRPAVGVLYVHGIGLQRKGQCVVEFADALYGWIRGRIVGVGQGHAHRHTSRETLIKAVPTAASPPGSEASRSERRSYLAFLESAHNFLPEAALAELKQVLLPAPPGEPLLASADLRDVTASDPHGPAAFSIELDWTDAQGRAFELDWLLAESWWADKIQAPSIWQLLAWAPAALPAAIAIHLFSRLQDEPAPSGAQQSRVALQSVLYPIVAVLATVLFLPFVYLLVLLSAVGGVLPLPRLAQAAKGLRQVLTSIIGDAFVFAGSAAQRSTIVETIRSDIRWLSDQCDSVVVVAHSQGAMLAYLACRERPANVRTLITLGSGVEKLRALIDALNPEDPVQRFSTGLLLTANLAGAGLWVAAVCGALGLISVSMAVFTALFAGAFAIVVGVFGFATYVTNALRVPPEEAVWDRWMQLGDVALANLDPLDTLRFVASGSLPGVMSWIDVLATRDPVAGQGPAVHTQLVHEATVQPPVGRWPRVMYVTNRRSLLFDHTSYLENMDECLPTIVSECAHLGGPEAAAWLAPDAHRARSDQRLPDERHAPIASARARIIALASRLEAVILIAVAGYLAVRFALLREATPTLLSSSYWRAVNVEWLDVGVVLCFASCWVAIRSAKASALMRLTASVLERRNWRVQRGAKGELESIDSGFERSGRLMVGEVAGIIICCAAPAIVLILMNQHGAMSVVIAVVFAAAVSHAVGLALRLNDNRIAVQRAYSG